MRVNIYIRKEDEEAWELVEDKPEWIHNNLRGQKLSGVKVTEVIKKVDDIKIPDHVYQAFDKTCKNGHIIGKFGKCLEKGCKYG